VKNRVRGSISRQVASSVLILGLLGATESSSQEDAEEWPKEIQTNKGKVILYQPQLDSLEGNQLKGRAAVALVPEGQVEPIFGAVWIEARIDTDLDTRIAALDQIRVPRVHFTESSEEQRKALEKLLTDEMPKWDLKISLDRLSAMLEVAERQSRASEGFDDSAPIIQIVDYPAVLVSIDGKPRLRQYGESDFQYVINSPFLIVQEPGKKTYYLYAGSETWYESGAVEGPWEVAKKVPKKVRKLEPEDEEVEADSEEDKQKSSTPPAVIVSTEPTELIVTDGAPEYAPIAGGELLVVTNTESDILVEIATQRTFVLLSGRWFAAPSTDGPWEFVAADALPGSFSQIDPDSDQGHLLTWVAGTELADEIVLEAYIPQTAAIKRDATIQVSYDGEPKFEPIEETSLHYAVNTENQVIQAGTQYYCAYEGAWYVAGSPRGPWKVATEVPDEIRKIPPSSPVYNTQYVYIYDSTPEVVYVGYYPGYTHSYHYHGCLVYGTGWYYNPWYGPGGFYPRHSTWGFHVRWNPWSGWGFGFSYSTGRWTFGIGYGGWYRRGWWGPRGYRGYRRGYNRGWNRGYRSGRRSGYNAGYRSARRDAGRNIYQRQNNASRVADSPRASGARSQMATSTLSNNVFSDRNGNVHKQGADGSWKSRQDGQWKQGQDVGGPGSRERPSGATSSGQRPSSSTRSGSTQSLNRDAQARSRGSQRSQSYQRSGGSRGGGRSRGGGGGRR
jgi:hypothetical protein